MSLDNPNGIESSVSNNKKQRRTFLKRASAGAVIASIPGRSAWAGIAGSIVASGHGSDFNQGECTVLIGADGFAPSDYPTTFSSVFGAKPFNQSSGTVGDGTDYTFGQILSSGAGTDQSGYFDINLGLVLIYLNAVNHGNSGIYYPVLSQYQNSSHDFAMYLYTEALNNPMAVGTLLNNTISQNSSCL